MALLTIAEFKAYLQIESAEYDDAFAVFEPVVAAKVDDLCNRDIAQELEDEVLTDARLEAYKPTFAKMVLWEIAKNTTDESLRERVQSKQAGRLQVTYEKRHTGTGYPIEWIGELARLRRPRFV